MYNFSLGSRLSDFPIGSPEYMQFMGVEMSLQEAEAKTKRELQEAEVKAKAMIEEEA